MRRAFRIRRFRSISDPRAFAARLRNVRDTGPQARPVARVLRRMPRPVLQRLWMPLHFALRVIQRGTAPWNPPLRAAPALPPPQAAGILRERFHLSTRLVERSLRWLRAHHAPVAAAVAPPAGAAGLQPTSTRLLMMQRIERQALFPRVTQVLARPALAAASLGQAAGPGASRADEPRPGPLPGTPRGAAPAASALPALELARVTDHVIRQLDRRVLSYRERTGQL
jgi:hypothetical protein